MLRQAFHLLSNALVVEGFEQVYNTGVQGALPLVQQARIRYLMRERVPEGADQLRNKARLVEKIGCLKMPQGLVQCLRRQFDKSLEERYGYFGADDCSGLEETLLCSGEAVDTRRQHGPDGVWDTRHGWRGALLHHGPGEFF
jgi:hypothetical protein